MNETHKIDQLFNERFSDFGPELDRLGVWKSVEAKLDERGNTRKVFTGLLSFIIFVGVAYMLIHFTYPGKNTATSSSMLTSAAIPAVFEETEFYSSQDPKQKFSAIISDSLSEVQHSNKNEIIINSKKESKSEKPSITSLVHSSFDEEITIANSDNENKAVVAKNLHSRSNWNIEPLIKKTLSAYTERQEEFLLSIKKNKKSNPGEWSRDCKVSERSSFYFTPYVSGLYNFQSVSAISDQDAYAEKWNDYDEVLPGYAAGVLMGYETPFGLNAEAGLEWQQAFERLLFYQNVTETIKVYSDSAYYWEDENGNIEYFGDTVTTTRTYERKVQSLKKHRIWSIPVALGYDMELEKMKLGFQLGAIFHLDHTFKGRVYSPAGTFDYLTPADKGTIYNPKIGITWFGSVRLYFFPSDNVEWYLAPGFRYNARSWLQSDTGLKLFNRFGELKVGAKIYF